MKATRVYALVSGFVLLIVGVAGLLPPPRRSTPVPVR